MKREAFKMFLKPGYEEEYERRHAAIWPELKKLLSENGVYDYSIYWDKDTNILFACQKVKGEGGSQDMGDNPIVQKWWDYMADIMETNPDNSPVSIPLPELIYMESLLLCTSSRISLFHALRDACSQNGKDSFFVEAYIVFGKIALPLHKFCR